MILFFTDNKANLIAYVIGTLFTAFALEALYEISAIYYWKYIFMLPFAICLVFAFFSQYVTDDGKHMKMKFFWIFCLCGVVASFIINKVL